MKSVNALALGLAVAFVGATGAGAVEVRKVVEVKAAPKAVWAKVGEWCAIKDWHPAVADCKPGKGGLRTLTLKDGKKVLERITKTGKNTYSYAILESPFPVKNYVATLTAKADSLGSTDLTWVAKFDSTGKSDEEATTIIKGVFEGLDNVKALSFAAPAAAAAPTSADKPAAAAEAGAKKEDKLSAAAARDEARLKRREERRKRLEAAKLKALEEYAKVKAAIAERAKAVAEKAKAAYEKAKAAMEKAVDNSAAGKRT